MTIMQAIADRWSKYRRRRARINELNALDCADMRRLAQDCGLNVEELVELAKKEGDAAELLYRRMWEMRLYPTRIDGAIMKDMQRACSLCAHKELCAHELEDRPKQASWPRYCPNKETLEALDRIWNASGARH